LLFKDGLINTLSTYVNYYILHTYVILKKSMN